MNRIVFAKIVRDLIKEKGRTLLVVLALFVGIFSIAMMSTSFVVLNRELAYNYQITNPADATIWTTNLNDSVISEIKKVESVELVEKREKVVTRLKNGEGWIIAWLFVVDNFNQISINKFKLEKGSNPLYANQILIERNAKNLFGAEIAKNYTVKLPGKTEKKFEVTGIAHDPGLAPSMMEGMVYGYITKTGVEYLGKETQNNELKIKFKNASQDKEAVKAVKLQRVLQILKTNNVSVQRSEIHDTSAHPHQSQLNSLLFLILNFGVLTLFLSCVLVVNVITAIMSKQIRQIGILKTIGADNYNITRLYVVMVLIMGIIATILAIPLGIHAGLDYSLFASSMLNFTIYSQSLPHSLIMMQILSALLIPVLVSIVPILKSSRMSINECLNSYGVEEKTVNENSHFSRFISKTVPPIVSMAIKNTFRRKGRLVLTVMTMAIGGAIFMTALNVRASSDNMIEKAFSRMNSDITVNFDGSYRQEQVNQVLNGRTEIDLAEGYRLINGTISLPNGRISPPISVVSYQPDTKIIEFEMEDGFWLTDNQKVVINTALAGKHSYKTGDRITFKMGNDNLNFIIAGILREPFSPPKIYLDKTIMDSLKDQDMVEIVAINLKKWKMITDKYVSDLVKDFESKGIAISNGIQKDFFKDKVVEHLKVIVFMLIFMTLLVVIVGGLGQITSMSINILERQKEIGILRAIGMENNNLYHLVLIEGVLTGVMSWIISIAVSIPTSIYIGNKFSRIFFETGIDYTISLHGIIIWLVIVIVFSFVATLYPARSVTKQNLKNALEFE